MGRMLALGFGGMRLGKTVMPALRPSSHGRVPALNRKPPGLLAMAWAVQRKMRSRCRFRS